MKPIITRFDKNSGDILLSIPMFDKDIFHRIQQIEKDNPSWFDLEHYNIFDLIKENQELKKKYLNAVSDYETTMFEKEQLNSLVNSCQEEIRQLKKQLESANEQISYLRRSIERKEERIIDLQYERIPYTNEYVDKLLNQQKEFISYLEDEIEICDSFLDTIKSVLQETPYGVISANKDITTQIKENEIAQKVYKEILQKYKSIIGDKE